MIHEQVVRTIGMRCEHAQRIIQQFLAVLLALVGEPNIEAFESLNDRRWRLQQQYDPAVGQPRVHWWIDVALITDNDTRRTKYSGPMIYCRVPPIGNSHEFTGGDPPLTLQEKVTIANNLQGLINLLERGYPNFAANVQSFQLE